MQIPIDLNDLVRLRREQETDEANAVGWLDDAKEGDILAVWDAIQRLGGSPLKEIISRFAQLGMTHAILLRVRPEPRG